MVDISSQLISLLKDLQNTQASAVFTMTDETGLPNGVAPGDELKATVVGKLSDLYLIQVDNRLIRARTQLPLKMGDGLRLRVMDNNTPATVRVLEHLPQQAQPSAGSGVKTFMALKSALFHVSPQIESLLENISNKGVSISNLPEGIQHTVSTLNALTQGGTAQPDKIRALFALFAFDAPNTLAPDAASTSTIFMQMLQEGLDAMSEQMPFLKTSTMQSAVPPPLNTVGNSDSTYSNSPQSVPVQHSPVLGKSDGMQAPLSAVGDVQPSASPVPSVRTDAAAVPVPSLNQAQVEPKDAGLAARPVWLYETGASLQRDGVQQGVLPVTAQVDIQATDTSVNNQNIQTALVRQEMEIPLNHTAKMPETGSPQTVTVQQPDLFKDIQRVQGEMSGQVRAQSQGILSNTARVAPQDGMTGVRFERTATIADEQALGAVQTTAHRQETDARGVLHTMNLLAQHMDKMQAFRIELQQQTGMNFWLVPLWFNGDSGSGHMIWWQDHEDERKNGESKGSFGYNLLFDLQLSRLGSLKIRLSCSGKTVQCSVAAEKEALPVIRHGIEELRSRLDSIGFSMRLAELSLLSGLESKAFDPLGGSLTSPSGVLNIVA